MTDMTALHNKLAGEIVAAIVRPVIAAGGDHVNVLVVLESVIVGTVLVVAKLGGDEIVIDALMERVKERLAEMRLGGAETKGSA